VLLAVATALLGIWGIPRIFERVRPRRPSLKEIISSLVAGVLVLFVWAANQLPLLFQAPPIVGATTASPTSAAPIIETKKFYSEADKNRIVEGLYALSVALTDKAMKSVEETNSFMQLWESQTSNAIRSGAPVDTKSLVVELDQIRLHENEFENDMDGVMKKYVIYRDELIPALGGSEGGRKRLPFRESIDEIATGTAVLAGVQEHGDKSLVELTIKLMREPLQTFQNNSNGFGGWINDCRKRIDEIRKSLL
jgi:hypothetical protein